MQSYTKGLAGIFWFTAPNVACFFVFAPIAFRIRKLMPNGYTLPEFIYSRFGKQTHLAFLIIFLGYQIGAIVINSLAGGILLSTLCGIDLKLCIILVSLTALSYAIISGLRASVVTDFIQMTMILVIVLMIVPLCLSNSNGIRLGGVNENYQNIFNPWIAFSMGIPMTLSLIAGPIADQMFFQRALSLQEKYVKKSFMCAGLIFAIVPIILSLLGFIGADLSNRGLINVEDSQMVAPVVIAYLLPKSALYAFTLMAFAGLCSTMDSAFCALSSLGSIDIYKRYINPKANDRKVLFFSRWFMIFMAFLGTSLALLNPDLLWVFLIYGALASAGMFPCIFALYWSRATAKGTLWAVALSVLVSLPISIYGNITENQYIIVFSSVLSVLIGLIVCIISSLVNKDRKYNFKTLRYENQL